MQGSTGIELQYFNPTLFLIPVRENQPKQNQANGFLYFGLKYAQENFSIWSEYLLDDYQIDKSVQEPTTYAFLFGAELKHLQYIINSVWIEYSMAANQTYQTHGQYGEENYVHRDFPIGHYLGNDFDNLVANLNFQKTKVLNLTLEPILRISLIRDGANGIEIPYYEPWNFEENLKDNFNFDFPTGPVSNYFESALTGKLSLNKNSYIEIGLINQNLEYQKNSKSNYAMLLRYYLAFDRNINY